jgi:hypothetical protein
MGLRQRALAAVGRLVVASIGEQEAQGLLDDQLTSKDLDGSYDDVSDGQSDGDVEDAVAPVRLAVPLPPGYDDVAQRGQLIAALHANPAMGPAWQVESITDNVATVFKGSPSTADPGRPDLLTIAPGAKAKATSAPETAAWADSQGRTLVEWDFLHGRFVTAATPPAERRLRDKVAEYLKISNEPWRIDMSVEWSVNPRTRLGEVTVITVHRSPAILSKEKRRETWLEVTESVVPAPDGTNWWVQDDSAEGHITLRRAEDPLGAIIDYPWDADVSVTSIPFGIDAKRTPITLGLLELNMLLGGSPGSGKSGGLATLLCGIARLENVAIIGLDPKKVELSPWRTRFSRISRYAEDSTVVLGAIIEEMSRRYDWLEERDLKKIGLKQLSAEMPLIVVVVDELADLVSMGATPVEKAADTQRASRIRRIVALGRAAGIIGIFATQKPQSNVVPTELRDLIQMRVGYATTTSDMSNTILGAGMNLLGGLSHEIPANLKGVCYIVSDTSRTPVRGRTYFIPDGEGLEGEKSPVRVISERYAHLRVELPWMPAEGEPGKDSEPDQYVVLGAVPTTKAGITKPTTVELDDLVMTLEDLGDDSDEEEVPTWARDFAAVQGSEPFDEDVEESNPFAQFMV